MSIISPRLQFLLIAILLIGVFTRAASAAVPASQSWKQPIRNFHIELTDSAASRPFMEEPSPAADGPRFKFRGTKGWKWTSQQYLEEIPFLKEVKMNFLMNCYLSLFDEKTGRNRWWEPFSEERKADYAKVIKACQDNGITFCFAMHPHLWCDRPMRLDSDDDFEAFFARFKWAQSLGVKFFSISMDDVDQANAGHAHAQFCNKFLARLRQKDADAQLILCPTTYTTASARQNPQYLRALAEEMNKDVYVFWTGVSVVPLTISRADAEEYKSLAGHRLILWDNYPVNDAHPTLHLGPITGRDPALAEVCDGYMSNPHSPQSQINRVPLFTMADYAYAPGQYNPMHSVAQAIAYLAQTPAQRRALVDLVELYPGDIISSSEQTSYNSVRQRYQHLNDRAAADSYIASLERVLSRMTAAFPDRYRDAAASLGDDMKFIKADYAKRYGKE